MVWLIGALLVIARLDRIPDPPAAKPEASFSAFSLAGHLAAAIPASELIFPPVPVPALTVALAVVPVPPGKYRIVLVEHAADPSPPAFSVPPASA